MPPALSALAAVLLAAQCDGTGPDGGTILWSVQRFALTDGMALTDSTVIVGTRDSGSLLSLDLVTGSTVWERRLDPSYTFFFGRLLPIVGGVVFAAPYDLFAVDAETGGIRWTHRVETPRGVTLSRDPSFSGDAVFVGNQHGYVTRLNRQTGAVEWQTDLKEAVFPTATTGDLVIVGTRSFSDTVIREGPFGAGRVVALSGSDGSLVWQVPVPDSAGFPGSGGVVASPLVVGQTVVVGTRSSRVLGLSLQDGSVLWEYSTASPLTAPYASAPVQYGEYAIFLRSDGLVEAFDPVTGQRAWSVGFQDGSTLTTPQVAGNRLYVVMSGQIWIIAPNGTVEWQFGASRDAADLPAFQTGPTVGPDGTIYAGWVEVGGATWVGAIRPPNR